MSAQEALANFDWAPIVDANPALSSPFFQPDFAAIVAEVRETRVAVAEGGAAFLPFHRYSLGVGKPLGNGLSDYQGIISKTLDGFDLCGLVRNAGLGAFEFNHVPSTQLAFASAATKITASPRVELAGIAVSKSLCDNARNRWRKLEREHGPVSFTFASGSRADFDLCLSWKREQYSRTGNYDIMADPWAMHVIERTRDTQRAGYSGTLSTLRAGDRLIAAHFGIRSHSTLHYWFPAYDQDFAQFSPGMLLLLSIIDNGHNFGLDIIDFGKGEQFYKSRLANSAMDILEGSVNVGLMGSASVKGRAYIRNLRSNLKRVRANWR